MNITRNDIDDLNAVITLKIEEDDYNERVNNVLKDYRRKANIPGFRPGKVPMGLIKKNYGKSVLLDEVNKILSESLFGYLKDNELRILGEPLPSKDHDKPIDFDNEKEFEFSFDIALPPEFDLEINEEVKIPYYNVQIDESKVDDQIEQIRKQLGGQENVEIVEEDDLVRGKIEQTDSEGNLVENGAVNDSALLAVNVIKDEEIKNKFLGANVNEIITFNPMKAYDNATEVATMLGVDKDNEELLNSDYQLTITEINRHKAAELNQELFDKLYGEGNVTSEDEMREKIREQFKNAYVRDADYKFMLDTRDKLIQETEAKIPADFLKRWLVESNQNQQKEEKLSPEQVEKEFPQFEKDLKWQLIKDKVIEANDLEVSEDEMLDYAKEMTAMQFQQYGMSPEMLGEDGLATYAQKILENKEEANKIQEHKLEDKVVQHIKKTVSLEEHEISHDDFKALFEQN